MNLRHSPPSPLPHYRLGREMPREGRNLVYAGLNSVTGEQVVIRRVSLADRLQAELANNQIQCLRSIQHPNVLAYHHHFYAQTFAFIVTEPIDYNLRMKIARDGTLSQSEALPIFLQILKGYEEVRKRGFLHRDLKPESILFSGNSWKIGAFGYCTRSRSGVVKERYNAGSPLYMAPEVLAQNLYSEKSDVWSLGLILYEMLHGRTAFQSKGELGLGREQRQQRISYQCHPNLAKILMKAIAFSHQMRPSLSELQTLIAHHISLTAGSENQISKGGITQNEKNYLRFMQYIKLLSSRCRDWVKSDRIAYLFEFNIRMRLYFITSFSEEEGRQSLVSKEEFKDVQDQHRDCLQLPLSLASDDRLRFFEPQNTKFSSSLLWQTQAELKELIKDLIANLTLIGSEEKVAKYEEELRLADFLMTAFVLNGIVISGENDLEGFSMQSQLSVILSHPQRFSLKIWQQMKERAAKLGLSPAKI